MGTPETQVPCHGHVGTRFPEGRSVPRLSAVVRTIPGTSDPIVHLYMPGPSPMVDTTLTAAGGPICVCRCSSPTVPHPRRPVADLLACLMFPLRPPTFPPRRGPEASGLTQFATLPGTGRARAMERPGVHRQREMSGSFMASNLTQAHREASESPSQSLRDAAPRLGSGREWGWGRGR